ncbi:prepilin peptidase [Georgenia muralis]|uniref:Type IV leader peptidase family protein n=1 Tax=Georgenia muralis TaxID=154117 RepID=A0A3N4ZSI3_9MICO|nr:A24 family peptidase [Georgenia muralis]RPF28478.1 type IV leader peptidase family protein [Georgenia muralis]
MSLPAAVLAAGAWLAAVSAALIVTDVRSHRLPDRLVGAAAAGVLALLTVAALTTGQWTDLARAVLAAGTVTAGSLLLALPRATGLGLGDVKLAGVLGLWLGWFGWLVVATGLLAAVVLGGAWTTARLLAGRARRDDAVPLGPWLVLGAALATVAHLAGPAPA